MHRFLSRSDESADLGALRHGRKRPPQTYSLSTLRRPGAPACGSRSLVVNSLQKPSLFTVAPIDPTNRSVQQFHIPLIASPLLILPGPPISGRAPGSGIGHNLMGSNACGLGRTKSPQGKLRDLCCFFVLCSSLLFFLFSFFLRDFSLYHPLRTRKYPGPFCIFWRKKKLSL